MTRQPLGTTCSPVGSECKLRDVALPHSDVGQVPVALLVLLHEALHEVDGHHTLGLLRQFAREPPASKGSNIQEGVCLYA